MEAMATTGGMTDTAAAAAKATVTTTAGAAAAGKAQAFAHRLVEFADREACLKFFSERHVDLDHANEMGWSVLMSACACGRDDLVGYVADRTTAFHCATKTNHTTVLHLAAMSKNPRIAQELTATAERQQKLMAIADQPNINGDTPLMMACVAKNVVAAKLLIEELHASVCQANGNGMTPLMCAARASDDPRPGAPTPEELMARSAEIVKVLLAHDADANAVEVAGGNTALHLAVLSDNVDAVQCLMEGGLDIELGYRNKAGNTAQDLSNRSSGVASATIGELLEAKKSQQEEAAAQVSAKVEQELTALAVHEAQAAEQKPAARPPYSKKSKKSKKKGKTRASKPDTATSTNRPVTTKPPESAASGNGSVQDVVEPKPEAPLGDSPRVEMQDEPNKAPETAKATKEDVLDGDNWQAVLPKRNRRKASISEKHSASSKPAAKGIQQRRPTTNSSAKQNPPPVSKPAPSASTANTRLSTTASSGLPLKASWATRTNPKTPTKPKTQLNALNSSVVTPQSLKSPRASKEENVMPNMSYEQLNASFQRAFPVATELEISVEQFLIASAASDRELEPVDSLSISQVEALQEAHWQAYHYLNEKKIELTRVLEAQRVEAQFALQQELLHMD